MFLQDFQVDAMEKFIEESSIPIVTFFDNDPNNHPYVNKFFEGTNAKVLESASCNAAIQPYITTSNNSRI